MAGGATKFVVLTKRRSGSTWVIDSLNNLEDTTAYHELFLPTGRATAYPAGYPRFIETKPKGMAVRPFSVFSYLNELYRKPGTVGYQLMYSQLRMYPEILAYLRMNHIRVIHLVRQNDLDVVISVEMAQARGQWHRLRGQPELDAIQICLDPQTLIGQMKRRRRIIMVARKLLHWCRLSHLEVAYDDLLRDQACFSLLWDFLSINPEGHMPQSNLIKIRKAGHADIISNYGEVKEALAGTEFAKLIE